MAKIKLSEGGFNLIPEGSTTFKITKVEYKEDFGKMTVEMQTKAGLKHNERFTLTKNNGEVNEGAVKAFSFFAKTALNNFQLDEIDDQDIVGCYIKATVKHEEYEYEKYGEMKKGKSARLNDYATAIGFGSGEETKEATEDKPKAKVDLDSFLDD